MRVPNFERSAEAFQSIGFVLIGVVLGAIAMMIVELGTAQTLTNQLSQSNKLVNELQEENKNLKKLGNRRDVILKTSVRFENTELDISLLDKLETAISNELKVAVGQPINLPHIYRQIVQGREYVSGDKRYRIRVTMLSIIGTEMTVYVTPEEVVSD